MNINEQAIKVIEILTSSPIVGHTDDHVKATAVNEHELHDTDLTLSLWRNITARLVLNKYIKPILEKEFQDIYEQFFTHVFGKAGLTDEKLKEASKEQQETVLNSFSEYGKEVYGVDVEKEDIEDENISIFPEKLKSENELKTDRIEEKVINTKLLGYFFILKDLRKLNDKLHKGFEFENLGKGNVIYKPETHTLFIGVEKINIKPTARVPVEHYILDHIKNNLSEEYYFAELVDDILIEGFERKTKKQYREGIRNLEEKIEIKTKQNIDNFIIPTTESFKINPNYLEED